MKKTLFFTIIIISFLMFSCGNNDKSDTDSDSVNDTEQNDVTDDSGETDDTVTDNENPDTEESDTIEPDTEEPDTVEPDTEEPDTVEPDTEEPDTEEPDTGDMDAEEPDTETPDNEPVRSNDATLKSLVSSAGSLNESFSSTVENYTVTVDSNILSVTVTPESNHEGAAIEINDVVLDSGTESGSLTLDAPGTETVITIKVTAEDETTVKTYTIAVTRSQITYEFPNGDMELWTSEEMGTATPELWTVYSNYAPTYKMEGDESTGFSLGATYSSSSWEQNIATSPEINCFTSSVPAGIRFRLKGSGEIAIKLKVGTSDIYYVMDTTNNVFKAIERDYFVSSDYRKFGDPDTGKHAWETFLIVFGNEMNGKWIDGNSMQLTVISDKGYDYYAFLDNFTFISNSPECTVNSECTDSSRPVCETDGSSEDFLTCVQIPPCSGVSIKDIRQNNGVNPNDVVTICEAVVTSNFFGFNNKFAFITDKNGGDYSGIKIYGSDGLSGFSKGDTIRITGTYYESGSRSQLKDLTIAKLPDANIEPVAVEVTIDNAKDEKFESRLIKITNAVVSDISGYENSSWGKIIVNNDFEISEYLYQFPVPAVDDVYSSITGILDNSSEGSYRLMPRSAEDMTTPAAMPKVIISEVVDYTDGVNDNGRFVEVFNAGSSSVDLTGYKLKCSDEEYLFADDDDLSSKVINAGQAIVIAKPKFSFLGSTTDYFFNVYGFSSDGYGDAADHLDGSNSVQLISPEDVVIDTFGEEGSDGTGTAWEYDDSVARRNFGITSPEAIFDASQWTITQTTEGTGDATPKVHFLSNPCEGSSAPACDEWMECNPVNSLCDILKDGRCAGNDDCSGDTPVCNESHVCVSGAAPNIVLNGDFESWDNAAPDHWQAKSSVSMRDCVKYTANIRPESTGSNACQIINGGGSTKYVKTELFSIDEGTYSCSYWVRGNGTIKIGFWSADPGNSYSSEEDVISETWIQKTGFTFTVPAGGYSEALIKFGVYDTNYLNSQQDIDDIQIDDVVCTKN